MESHDQKRGPSDATDYAATKAPETAKEAEERSDQPRDARLKPGGTHGAPEDTGMSSLERPISPRNDE